MSTTLATGQRAARRPSARSSPGDRPGRNGPTPRPHPRVRRALSSGPPGRLPFGVVSSFQKMQPYPIYAEPGQGQPRLGPGRDRVPRLPLRLRGHGGRPRPSRASSRRSTRRRAAAPTSRSPPNRRCVRRGDLPPVQPRDAALRQLGHRSDDGRHPGGARRHRTRRRLQDRRLLSRPPRQRDVLGRPQRRHHGRPRPARQRAGVQGNGEGRVEVHPGRAVQRRRPARARCSTRRAARSPASSWSRP